jgi:hypothetical protein
LPSTIHTAALCTQCPPRRALPSTPAHQPPTLEAWSPPPWLHSSATVYVPASVPDASICRCGCYPAPRTEARTPPFPHAWDAKSTAGALQKPDILMEEVEGIKHCGPIASWVYFDLQVATLIAEHLILRFPCCNQ